MLVCERQWPMQQTDEWHAREENRLFHYRKLLPPRLGETGVKIETCGMCSISHIEQSKSLGHTHTHSIQVRIEHLQFDLQCHGMFASGFFLCNIFSALLYVEKGKNQRHENSTTI